MSDIISSPVVVAVDPRGLPVRTVRYYRRVATDGTVERVERTRYDADGRVVAQYDARSVDRNVPVRRSSGALGAPFAWSADAGDAWQLVADTGAPLWSRDANGVWQTTTYDPAGRPVRHDEDTGTASRCLALTTYGTAEAWPANLAGIPVLAFDAAGRRETTRVALTGQVQASRLELLAGDTDPDWPDTDALEAPAITLATYDALGALLTQTDAAGHTQEVVRGVAGAPVRTGVMLAGSSRIPLATALHYGPSGELIGQSTANGVTRTWTYDPDDGRLRRTATLRDTTPLQRLEYRYDPVGNILAISDTASPLVFHRNARIEATRTFAYDAFHQLIEATGREHASAGYGPDLPDVLPVVGDPASLRAYTRAYAYDAGGNPTNLGTQAMTIAPLSNRALPASVTTDPAKVDGFFDASGNAHQLYPGGATLVWDGRHRLREVATIVRAARENDRELYLYDGGGQRVRKRWRHDVAGTMRIAETCYLGTLERHHDDVTHTHRDVITVALGGDAVRIIVKADGSTTTRYAVTDHLGSTAMELDETGQLASCEEYYPFGGTAWQAASSQLEADWRTVRYSGKERDATGLYYYGFRYYAPWLARWINPDPAGDVDGLNLYRMVRNNPIGMFDTNGSVGREANGGMTISELDMLVDAAANEHLSRRLVGPITALYPSAIDRPSANLFSAAPPAASGGADPVAVLMNIMNATGYRAPSRGAASVLPSVAHAASGWRNSPETSPSETSRSESPSDDSHVSDASGARLIERTLGGKVYRLSKRFPGADGMTHFDHSKDFTSVPNMISDGNALIVSGDPRSARRFAVRDRNYRMYEIDATHISGVSLNENFENNKEELMRHLGIEPHEEPATLDELDAFVGGAAAMNEIHIRHEDIEPHMITLVERNVRSPSPTGAWRTYLA